MRKYQYYDSGQDGDYDGYIANWLAQTFTVETAHMISKVKLKFFVVGDPGTITVSIKNTTAGKPSGADLASGSIEGVDITTDANGEFYEITLGSGYTFDKDTMYAIVVRAPGGNASNKISWLANLGDATFTGGTTCTSSDSGVDWGIISGADFMFEEWGVGGISPVMGVWGMLPKSQIDSETIEGAINRLILVHEQDEESHLGTGESLQSHKASEIIDHLASSIIADKIKLNEIWQRHIRSISAFLRLIAQRPDYADLINAQRWTGEAGENSVNSGTFDGEFHYIGLGVAPGKVIKINPATMETVAIWTGDTNEDYVISLISDGTYIYAGLYTSRPKIIKIDPVTMTTVATWTLGQAGAYARSLVFDGTNLYVSIQSSAVSIVKINPATMETVDDWAPAPAHGDSRGITFDGINLYVTFDDIPATVYQVNPVTMTTVATWTGAAGENYGISLTFDGTYIYVGLDLSPGEVIKINPTAMTTVAKWTGAAGENKAFTLTFDGTYLYTGLYLSPVKIIKIDRSNMAAVSVWTGDTGQNSSWYLSFDGNFLYCGLGISPAQLIRKILRDIDETAT